MLKRVRGEVFDWLRSLDTDDPQAQESESESSQDDADKKMRQKHRGRIRDAVFLIPNATLLRRAIDTIDKLFIPSRNQDTLGDIYEHLLGEIAEDRKNGLFRTPRHIIRVMCDLVNPQWNDRICDPACGTAGFLVNAYQHVIKTHTDPANLVFEGDGTPINTLEGRPFNMVGEIFPLNRINISEKTPSMATIDHNSSHSTFNLTFFLGLTFTVRSIEAYLLFT